MLIGIATPFRGNNFGTKLQAFAVQELISQLGFRPEIIQYESKFDLRLNILCKKIFSLNQIRKRMRQFSNDFEIRTTTGLSQKLLDRAHAIKQFEQHYRLSQPIYGFSALRKHAKRYSAVICGSDQIWLPENINAEFFTLEFAPKNVRRVAFAASFGVSQLPPAQQWRYKQFLSGLDCISVREKSGQLIIEMLTGKKVPRVLDPTLTVDFRLWQHLASSSILQRPLKYVLGYFLGTNPEHRKTAASLAKELGIPLVTIPHMEEFCPADDCYSDIKLFRLGPADFVSLIRDSSLVCTDSFHGTAFSILFRRPFLAFERFQRTDPRNTNSRVHSLLDECSLDSRLISDKDSVDVAVALGINYAHVAHRIESLRFESRRFLSNALANLHGISR